MLCYQKKLKNVVTVYTINYKIEIDYIKELIFIGSFYILLRNQNEFF